MEVGTFLDFEQQKIVIIIREGGREVRLKLPFEALKQAFEAFQNPLARQLLKLLGWEVELT